ncbi:MAG: hypothetical protein RR316_03855 [Clostridia bacterium]
MKNRLLIIVLLILALGVLVGCDIGNPITKIELNLNGYEFVYELNEEVDLSGLSLTITYKNGEIKNKNIADYMVEGLNTNTLGEKVLRLRYRSFKEHITYVVVNEKYLTVTFNALLGTNAPKAQKVLYGKKLNKVNDPIAPQGYDFIGWFIGQEAFNYDTPIKESVELIAKYQYNSNKMIQFKQAALNDIYTNINSNWYDDESYSLISAQYNLDYNRIMKAASEIEMDIIIEDFVKMIAQIKTYQTKLNDCVNELKKENYFTEQWNEIINIYQEAVKGINEYIGGAPTTQTIYNTAILAINNVITKAEDIALAEGLKNNKIRDLRNQVESLTEIYYSVENYNMIKALYNEGIEAISNAEGTKAVSNAYAEYFNKIKAISMLNDELLAFVKEIEGIKASYNQSDYFQAEWQQLNEIYNQAVLELRMYNGGAPTAQTIRDNAIANMDNVITMAEDIELSNHQKTVNCRELTNYFNSMKQDDYSVENWDCVKQEYNNGIIAINEAVGTKASAQAYAQALDMINAIAKLEEKLLNAISVLKENYSKYKYDDYFETQWQTLATIYNEALLSLREYIGGAPTADAIVNQAVVAMENVITKQEDIALAKNLKVIKIRDLTNYVNGLIESEYTPNNWSEIQTLLSSGIQSINDAVGTEATAEAYAIAITQIKAITKK